MSEKRDEKYWADWLVDAVACSTQNRAFLRGDPDEDKWATESIYLNALHMMKQYAKEQHRNDDAES